MPIYTVSQISEAIKKTLEGSFPVLQIKGEISNLRFQSSGHYYFSLKDEAAQISCALFRMDAAKLSSPLKDGDQIVAVGSLSVFTPKGAYQLIVKKVERQGLGDLLLKFEALKRKLSEKGYFNPERKKPLPKVPKRIGVITSPTGAVIQDIIQTLERRHKGFKLLLCPTKVQGEGSKEELVQAIEFLNQHALCDVIILGRGGGSLEDLWAFNEECVIDAVYRSKIPIISAVGHETDFTLCDFVADKRAPTPTAAAEMVAPELTAVMHAIYLKLEGIHKLLKRKLESDKRLLSALKKRPELTSSTHLLKAFYFKLDMIESKLYPLLQMKLQKVRSVLTLKKALLQSASPQKRLEKDRGRMLQTLERLSHKQKGYLAEQKRVFELLRNSYASSSTKTLEMKKNQLIRLKELLHALNPKQVLDKGYAMIYNLDGSRVITSNNELSLGDELRLYLKDGSSYVKVTEKTLQEESCGK